MWEVGRFVFAIPHVELAILAVPRYAIKTVPIKVQKGGSMM